MLQVNEQRIIFHSGTTVGELAKKYKPTADLFILNGFPVPVDTEVLDGDTCTFIQKGVTPSPDEFEIFLTARHTPGIQKKIKQSTVAILGLGGLGSAVAGAMAKIGIGKMLLSDYDVVEPSNLNRQHYFVDQIGMLKTNALRDNILRMNPSLSLELIDKRLTEQVLPGLFADVDVLIECFDDPAMKAATLRSILTRMKNVAYVGSSGMAGFGENNAILTRMERPGIYIVGDETSEARPGMGLMAPRVGIAAHHQANQALRIILGVAKGRE
ncbi:MAG TPA: sulfur carrier protein ThiS adenylyltransferase ThiF [Desulfobacterales bacterium]|nr:sulfur carrier protein ThiS adenylyltransferase ThiF [Desulfobacterales bacterium]HIP38646.1 sulfur carrier protein ThiS adenylyltransferase ThiF [Desulfocapsa sulfexigens]